MIGDDDDVGDSESTVNRRVIGEGSYIGPESTMIGDDDDVGDSESTAKRHVIHGGSYIGEWRSTIDS